MRSAFEVAIVILLSAAAWSRPAADIASVVGSWEGDSKCAVAASACHDEHALYRIAPDKKGPAKLTVDGYKIVDGTPVFMGTLACTYHADQSILSCSGSTSQKDDWEFQISGDTMTGTLKIGDEKTLYRRITLRKTHPKES
jgi:hypothetical protein